MSHYEERLERDLEEIRERIRTIGSRVEEALRQAVHALATRNRSLAYQTILGDLAINRSVRDLDQLCHAFVARHLPSAGHLRFISSVLRLNVALERIGDHAVTICREAVQLGSEPPVVLARDIELLAEQSRRVLRQAMKSFNDANAELARGTMTMAVQADSVFRRAFADLVGEERDESSPPLRDLFAFLVIFSHLVRVSKLAKNICEETVFTVLGETKAPKVYAVLFVDEANACQSQLAEAFARKAFPESGRYASAGWRPAESLEPRLAAFLDRHGLATGDLRPTLLEPLPEELADYHVIVSLGGEVRPHIPEIPFHTIYLEWKIGPGLEGLTDVKAEDRLTAMHQEISCKVRELMEALRGEGAS